MGTPWTLAAYAMEGKADRDCKQTKVRICRKRQELWKRGSNNLPKGTADEHNSLVWC